MKDAIQDADVPKEQADGLMGTPFPVCFASKLSLCNVWLLHGCCLAVHCLSLPARWIT